MIKNFFVGLIIATFSFSADAAIDAQKLERILYKRNFGPYGGIHFDIDKTMQEFGLTRLEAVEFQANTRSLLEERSGSYLSKVQAPLLADAAGTALNRVKSGKISSIAKEPPLKANQFYVMLDLDEALLAAWHTMEEKELSQKFFKVKNRDTDGYRVYKETESVNIASDTIVLRPYAERFLDRVAQLPGFAGFVVFSAKDARSTVEIADWFAANSSAVGKHLKGVFGRHHLTVDNETMRADKDLRIVNENFRQVIAFDDGSSVRQTEQQFKVAKYDPGYAEYARELGNEQRAIYELVLPFTLEVFGKALARSNGNAEQAVAEIGEGFSTRELFFEQYENYLVKKGISRDLFIRHKSGFNEWFEPSLVFKGALGEAFYAHQRVAKGRSSVCEALEMSPLSAGAGF